MKSFEDMLPVDQSLEGIIRDSRDELYDLLDDYQSQEGDIIDINQEIHRDIVMLGQFSDTLGEKLARHEDDIRPASDAIYRSICFAAQVSDDTLPSHYHCELLGYIRERLQTNADGLEPLIADSQEYLQHRPEVDTLLTYYMPEIDKSGRYGHLAELFASLVFMLSERSIGEHYTKAQLDTLTPDDFTDETN